MHAARFSGIAKYSQWGDDPGLRVVVAIFLQDTDNAAILYTFEVLRRWLENVEILRPRIHRVSSVSETV
jgi:hypothetical protein